jgi:release factor glutamine methyltransferase
MVVMTNHPIIHSDLLNWGRERLESAGIDDSAISAELLLRSLLGLSRSAFVLAHRKTADPNIEIEYKALIERRAAREPLQYLVGWVDFYNVTLKTDRRALIPRPETETLVEIVLGKLNDVSAPSILDIGVGSGNIAVALAKNRPDSNVIGVDISADALQLAAVNASHNDVSKQISLVQGDIRNIAFASSLGNFDCVVSNPPYIAASEKDNLQPEITRFEPEIAVFSGDDPLIFFKTIIACLSYILKAGGVLAFEVGMGQARLVADLMAGDFDSIEIKKDLTGIERVITGIYARPDKR